MGGSQRTELGELLDLVASEYGKDPFWVLNLDLDQFLRLLDIIGKRKGMERAKTMTDFNLAVSALFSEEARGNFEFHIRELQGQEPASWDANDLAKIGLSNGR